MSKFKRCQCKRKDDCSHPWWAKVHPTGKSNRPVRVSLEAYFGQPVRGRGASNLANDLEATLAKHVKSGQFQDQQDRQADHGLTMDQLMDRYQRDHLDGLQSGKHEKRKLAEFRAMWGARNVATMKQNDFTAYARALEKRTKSGAGVRRPLARLRHMFTWAVAHGLCEHMPFSMKAMKIREEDPPRGRLPSPDELQKILDAASPFLRDWIELKLDTGLRSSTMRQLMFSHVDYALGTHGSLLMPRELFKNRKRMRERVVVKSLTKRAHDIIKRRAEETDKTWAIFAQTKGENKGKPYATDTMRRREWLSALRKAGLIKEDQTAGAFDLHEHDLRAESATRVLQASGGRIDMVKRHLGNMSLGATEAYMRGIASESDDIAKLLEPK